MFSKVFNLWLRLVQPIKPVSRVRGGQQAEGPSNGIQTFHWAGAFVFQDTSRRYENKAGAFITGIDVNSKVTSGRPDPPS